MLKKFYFIDYLRISKECSMKQNKRSIVLTTVSHLFNYQIFSCYLLTQTCFRMKRLLWYVSMTMDYVILKICVMNVLY